MFKNGTTRVCFFEKALYGLKQALWVWYQTFLDFLRKLNFYKTEGYYDLFVSLDKTMFIVDCIYNLLLFGADIYSHTDDIIWNL